MRAHWVGWCLQDLGFGGHGRGGAGRRGLPIGLEGRLLHGLVSTAILRARGEYSQWVRWCPRAYGAIRLRCLN
jgi:hypothetical protein